ncbi:hypothetical protein AB0L70_07370 [Kribbella sp. NPDC051952]|uniref:hypothetical protein n=1 Tax=Kribbella sp. NPDC051952 TaxID=3154851 RepID=UPI003428A423
MQLRYFPLGETVGRGARGGREGVARGDGVAGVHRLGVAVGTWLGVAGTRLGVADGGRVGVALGTRLGVAVGGSTLGVCVGTARGDRVGCGATDGVAISDGVAGLGVYSVGVAGEGVDTVGPPSTPSSPDEPPLRAIAVPATATPITAAAAIPPSSTRVIRRFRPASSIVVALRTF